MTTVNRIDETFAGLRSGSRKGFIPYICAGDPDLATTIQLARTLVDVGADVLELGLPFSDPLADGIVNQLAAQRALASGTTIDGVLNCVRQVRQNCDTPIVVYTYLNPILQFGFDRFHEQAAAAGVDGLLILDLPPEEEIEGRNHGLAHIRLIAPTTSAERMKRIAENARGFLYYVSREGVTGARDNVAASLDQQIAEIRRVSSLPIAVGFGISNPEQAKAVAQHADAVVIGSAIVDLIAHEGRRSLNSVGDFARSIVRALA